VIRISAAELAALAAEVASPTGAMLARAVDTRGPDLTASSLATAASLLSIYRVRLARWEEERVPVCVGLPEFVDALAAWPGDKVALLEYPTDERSFVVLMTPVADRILACVAIDRDATNGES
jgi:hypothetical protein